MKQELELSIGGHEMSSPLCLRSQVGPLENQENDFVHIIRFQTSPNLLTGAILMLGKGSGVEPLTFVNSVL